ncbi:MAG: hypothetical protein WBV94_09095 [Blastocatellia bacterium]
MREAHLFTAPRSPKLRRFAQLAPFASRKLDCVPDGVGGICYNCPPDRAREFERAARLSGLQMQWGGGGGTNYQATFPVGPVLYAISQSDNLFRAIDISDPTAPSLLGSVALSGAPTGLYVYNSVAYVCNSDGDLIEVNVDDPTAPTVASTTASGVNFTHIFIIGGYAFLTGTAASGIGIFNVSESPAVLVGIFANPGGTSSGIVRDRRFFYADAFSEDDAANIRSARIGGFQCHAISAGSLGADILDVGQVEARHGYFKGELVASSLTIAGGDSETETGVVSVANKVVLGTIWIMWGSGSPNGVVTAPIGSSFHSDNGNIYRNTDGATAWTAM